MMGPGARVDPSDSFYLKAEHAELPLNIGVLIEAGKRGSLALPGELPARDIDENLSLELAELQSVLSERLVKVDRRFRLSLDDAGRVEDVEVDIERVVSAVDVAAEADVEAAIEETVSRLASTCFPRRAGHVLWLGRLIRAGDRRFVFLQCSHALRSGAGRRPSGAPPLLTQSSDAYGAMSALLMATDGAGREGPDSEGHGSSSPPSLQPRGWRSGPGCLLALAEHAALFLSLQLLAQLLCLPCLLLSRAIGRLLPSVGPAPPREQVAGPRAVGLAAGLLLLVEQHLRYAWRAMDAALFGRTPFIRPASPAPRGAPAKQVLWTRSLALGGLKEAARARGATLNDAFLGCVAAALASRRPRAAAPAPEPVAYVLFNLRASGPLASAHPAPGAFNRSGFAALRLPTQAGPDAGACMRAASARMALLKRGAVQPALTAALLRLLGRLPRRAVRAVQGLLCPRESVLCTNVRGPDERLHIAGCPVLAMRPLAPPCTEGGIAVSLLSYAGCASVGLVAPAGADPSAADLRAALELHLAELAGAAVPQERTCTPAPPASKGPLHRRPAAAPPRPSSPFSATTSAA
eukprot:tig00000863_g4963.t1